MYVYVYICIYIYVCVCVCIYIYIYTYIYIYIVVTQSITFSMCDLTLPHDIVHYCEFADVMWQNSCNNIIRYISEYQIVQ